MWLHCVELLCLPSDCVIGKLSFHRIVMVVVLVSALRLFACNRGSVKTADMLACYLCLSVCGESIYKCRL
jgi:hypothetical protein